MSTLCPKEVFFALVIARNARKRVTYVCKHYLECIRFSLYRKFDIVVKIDDDDVRRLSTEDIQRKLNDIPIRRFIVSIACAYVRYKQSKIAYVKCDTTVHRDWHLWKWEVMPERVWFYASAINTKILLRMYIGRSTIFRFHIKRSLWPYMWCILSKRKCK